MSSIFLLGLAILPFFWWPWHLIPYEVPKVWFFAGWIEVWVVFFIFSISKKQLPVLNKKVWVLVSAWLGWSVIASLMGVNIWKSWYGNPYRLDGLLTVCHLLGLSLLVAAVWKKSWHRRSAWVVALTAVALSIWAVGQALTHHWFELIWKGGEVFASGLTFGQPNFLAGYLMIATPFILFLISESKSKGRKQLLGISMGVVILATLLTQSFGSLVGIGLGLIGWWLVRRQKSWWFVILAGVSVVSFWSLAWYHYRDQFVAESRERLAHKVISGALQRPITGWGWGNVDYAFRAGTWRVPILNDVYLDKAHSHFLEMFTTTGAVGLLLYLCLVGYMLRILIQRQTSQPSVTTHRLWLVVLIVFLYHSQTNVISINEELFFWVVLGLVGRQRLLSSEPTLPKDSASVQ